MTAFAILVVLMVILLIAKWNTSNTLFWKLFLSFILGVAACGLYNKCTTQAEDANDEPTKVAPMPSQTPSDSLVVFMGEAMVPATESSEENSASKETATLRDKLAIKTHPSSYIVSIHSPPPLGTIMFDTS